jgi:hypothetical protein
MQRWLLLLGLSLAACRNERTASESGAELAASNAAAASRPPNPFAAHALPPEDRRWLEGSVEETLAAGSYVYLRVRTAEETPVWVASLAATTPAPPLGQVRVLVLGRAEHFHSRRLARDFSPLSFGVIRAGSSDRNLTSKGIEP